METLTYVAIAFVICVGFGMLMFFTGRFTKELDMKRSRTAKKLEAELSTTDYESLRSALDAALGTVSQLAATAELHQKAIVNFGQLNVAEWIQNHNRAFGEVAEAIKNLNERMKAIEERPVVQQPVSTLGLNVETLAQTLQQTVPPAPESLKQFVENRERELRTVNEYGEHVEPYVPNVSAKAPIAPPPPPPDFEHFPQARIERGLDDMEQAKRKLRKKGIIGGGKAKGK